MKESSFFVDTLLTPEVRRIPVLHIYIPFKFGGPSLIRIAREDHVSNVGSFLADPETP